MGKRFSSSPKRPNQLCSPPTLPFNGYKGSFPVLKRAGLKVNHSPLSGAEFKNE